MVVKHDVYLLNMFIWIPSSFIAIQLWWFFNGFRDPIIKGVSRARNLPAADGLVSNILLVPSLRLMLRGSLMVMSFGRSVTITSTPIVMRMGVMVQTWAGFGQSQVSLVLRDGIADNHMRDESLR